MAPHGRYTVVRKLANGGMAEIFLAMQQGHEGFQKPVVLKRILGSVYSDPQFRNMLIDEAHISMSLTHSNIVQVLDLGLAGGRYFLVLELIDGWDLGHILQRAKAAAFPLPPGLGLFVVTEICRALAYAHAKRGANGESLGIVHRDVSPNNVLISEHGEVKLADFGIAKAMNKREHTGTGVVKGKVAFMSPEQGLGKPIDGRSDVFSLGTLLYVVTVGVRPFEAATDLEVLLRVQRAEFKAPGRARPDMGPELTSVITRAMRMSPDERYQTADDMLLDLERLLRALYGGVGQTELKQYLAELGRRDGVPPIGRAEPMVDDAGSRSDAALLEGKAVILGDDQDDLADERTDLAEFMAVDGASGPRLTRRAIEGGRGPGEAVGGPELGSARHGRRIVERVELGPDSGGLELTPQRSGRRAVEELSIPEGAAEDAPPERFRRKKSRAMPTLLVLLLLGGAAYVAAQHFGWTDQLMGWLDPARTQRPVAGDTLPTPAPAGSPSTPTSAPAHPPAPSPPVPPAPPPERAAGASRRAAAAPEAEPPPPSVTPPAEPMPPIGEAPKPGVAPEPGTHAQPPAPAVPARGPRVVAKRQRAGGGGGSRDVFKESARRVRSLSQGLDQLPPGTIELPPPLPDPPPNP